MEKRILSIQNLSATQITIEGVRLIQTANEIIGLKIGTTNGGGKEVYTAPSPLTAYQFIETDHPDPVFNFNTDTPIYITATNWNGSSVGIGIIFEDLNF